MAIRIGINGFGRIGRLVYRIAAERGIEIVAVNDLVPADNLAYLLKYDTMHRRFTLGGKPAEVTRHRGQLHRQRQDDQDACRCATRRRCRGRTSASTTCSNRPASSPTSRRPAATSRPAPSACIISAPTKSGPEQVPTFCLGVNHDQYDPAKHTVISNASCTTNCLAPIAKVHQRHLRPRRRPDDDHPRRHRDAADAGRPEQEGLARRPQRLPEHHPGQHRRREGRGAVHPGAQGQAHRHGVPRPDGRRLGRSTSPSAPPRTPA